MNFMRVLCAGFFIFLSACAENATRLSMAPDEVNSLFVVKHSIGKKAAFEAIELGLAEAFNDLNAVLKLRQPESGIFLLKPVVSYPVGLAALPVTQYAPYTLKIKVTENSVEFAFTDLGPSPPYQSYPPESSIPHIRTMFQRTAALIAKGIDGKIDPL